MDDNGKAWEKIVKWFGYKLHLIVDATYELPVTFKVTKASASDITEGHELLHQMQERQPEILKTAETMAADRGYD
ncbi:transposase, partial [Frankia sp. Mgl5]|nr:transposase [Frankia sp. Mgl5]